jgi:hypothetical protein
VRRIKPNEVAMMKRMQAAADAVNARIENCHEEVACPKCRAPVGKRCAAMRGPAGGGYAVLEVQCGQHPATTSYVQMGELTKHPHQERWTQVVPAR